MFLKTGQNAGQAEEKREETKEQQREHQVYRRRRRYFMVPDQIPLQPALEQRKCEREGPAERNWSVLVIPSPAPEWRSLE